MPTLAEAKVLKGLKKEGPRDIVEGPRDVKLEKHAWHLKVV